VAQLQHIYSIYKYTKSIDTIFTSFYYIKIITNHSDTSNHNTGNAMHCALVIYYYLMMEDFFYEQSN